MATSLPLPLPLQGRFDGGGLGHVPLGHDRGAEGPVRLDASYTIAGVISRTWKPVYLERTEKTHALQKLKMLIAMNRFKVIKEERKNFEDLWVTRQSHVEQLKSRISGLGLSLSSNQFLKP